MWFEPLLHIIYAYMITFTLFICLIQNTDICTVYHKTAKNTELWILLILPSPTLKKCAFGNILLDAPYCGLKREAKIFFFP